MPAPGVELKRDNLVIQNAKYDRLLRRLGRLGKLNLLFDRTPRAAGTTFSTDFRLAGNLSELLPKLSKDRFVWKKRAAFLLFRPEDWPAEARGNLPPWPLVRDLRAAAAGNGGYLRPEDWIRLGRFDSDLLEFLDDEFSDAGRQQIGRVPELMRLASQANERERRLWDREGGAGWSDLSAKSRAALQDLMPQADLRRIRLLLRWDADAKTPTGTFYLGPPEGLKRPIKLTFKKRIEPVEEED